VVAIILKELQAKRWSINESYLPLLRMLKTGNIQRSPHDMGALHEQKNRMLQSSLDDCRMGVAKWR
jgi:hypothetical protein